MFWDVLFIMSFFGTFILIFISEYYFGSTRKPIVKDCVFCIKASRALDNTATVLTLISIIAFFNTL